METKTCSMCGCEKRLNEFHKNRHKSQGRQNRCKVCVKDIDAKWFKENKKRKQSLSRKRTQALLVQFRNWKSEKRCLCCLEHAAVCLELHHLDPTVKEHNISNMVTQGSSWKSIMDEAKKCIVVCSNCHKKIHAKLINVTNYLRVA